MNVHSYICLISESQNCGTTCIANFDLVLIIAGFPELASTMPLQHQTKCKLYSSVFDSYHDVTDRFERLQCT